MDDVTTLMFGKTCRRVLKKTRTTRRRKSHDTQIDQIRRRTHEREDPNDQRYSTDVFFLSEKFRTQWINNADESSQEEEGEWGVSLSLSLSLVSLTFRWSQHTW